MRGRLEDIIARRQRWPAVSGSKPRTGEWKGRYRLRMATGARGDDPPRVKPRAGHKSFTTTEGCIREAKSLGASFGVVFSALPKPC